MTAKEKAKQLTRIIHDHYCKDNLRKLTETAIEQAIIAAEKAKAKEEREACAMIADEMKAELSQRPEKLQYGRNQIEVAEYIANQIRAQSER